MRSKSCSNAGKKDLRPKNHSSGIEDDGHGKLRKVDPVTGHTTNESFDFNVSDDPDYNQKHYEALGEIINHHVYGLLEHEGLKRLLVPKDSSDPVEFRTFVFASEDFLENDKLVVLIHGSGVVRAGQWARRLIINDNLNSGTQIPYVKKARELGYAVIVLNTNDNNMILNGKMKEIKGSEDPQKQMETVWKDYIHDSKAKHIAIIAHSYGGVCTVKFGMNHVNEVKERIFAITLTDSVHVMPSKGVDHIVKKLRISEDNYYSKACDLYEFDGTFRPHRIQGEMKRRKTSIQGGNKKKWHKKNDKRVEHNLDRMIQGLQNTKYLGILVR